ncbi:DUF1178 family protein [Candidatus Pelagibacter sp.]|nr:DUF1178 family protein [Candidatus Pelagibacter sp.]
MIKYRLICKNCKISFDSWFASSLEFEKLKAKSFLNCHHCNSNKIEKTLMAPKLINRSKDKITDEKKRKYKEIDKKIKEYQKFIKNNFDYVGKNFAYEARSIHYNKKKTKKGIYGSASNEELKELSEEGIEAEIIPWIEDKSN